MLQCTPIGYFSGRQSEKYMAPKQSGLALENNGIIILEPNLNFEQALEDLSGFERIWLLYWFDRNEEWKPKVLTPRGGQKRGVFSTRSPHRPNPIGLSCVELKGIENRKLFIGANDLLDGTPILDIKPYLNYADAFPESRQGWLDEGALPMPYEVHWSVMSKKQAQYIEEASGLNLIQPVELRLSDNPFPFPNHRIKELGEGDYELSMKTWRVHYSITDHSVFIKELYSGYDAETLQGSKDSKWDDVPLHIEFINRFK